MPLAPHAVHSSTEPPDKVNLESAYDREMQRTETEILKILESSQTLMRVLERKERRHDTTHWGPRKNPAAKIPPAPRTPSRPPPSPRDASSNLPTPASLFPTSTSQERRTSKDNQQCAGADLGAGQAAAECIVLQDPARESATFEPVAAIGECLDAMVRRVIKHTVLHTNIAHLEQGAACAILSEVCVANCNTVRLTSRI